MKVYSKIDRNRYVDSLETLFMTAVINSQEGVEVGFAAMAKASLKSDLAKNDMLTDEINALKESDFVIVARCESQEVFDAVIREISKDGEDSGKEARKS
ncbi:MAG: hypothetical protein IIU44_02320, partial [Spirochaetales bacterium]|nr:hypothetical protein [Spirochaetales bacterium]